MRPEWYGDKRDLVKWGVLLELCEEFNLAHILQVLYYRFDHLGKLEVDGRVVDVPQPVVRHFRNLGAVCSISSDVGIEVFEEPFKNRHQYLELLLERIRERTRPGIVFLDPDTGLEPPGGCTAKHVSESEVSTIWNTLRSTDLLVLYQHKTTRGGAPWEEAKRKQLAAALSVPVGNVKLGRAPKIASDVIFLYAAKL